MIDLVFVLTNKLEMQVKDVRKTVAENQENNQIKIDEITNVHMNNLTLILSPGVENKASFTYYKYAHLRYSS